MAKEYKSSLTHNRLLNAFCYKNTTVCTWGHDVLKYVYSVITFCKIVYVRLPKHYFAIIYIMYFYFAIHQYTLIEQLVN